MNILFHNDHYIPNARHFGTTFEHRDTGFQRCEEYSLYDRKMHTWIILVENTGDDEFCSLNCILITLTFVKAFKKIVELQSWLNVSIFNPLKTK